MGLFEKARHLADARLRALTEPGSAVSGEALRCAILELDSYRRELRRQLADHRREEERLISRISERSAALALWQARRALAEEHHRADLVEAAARRTERERSERDQLERERGALHAAIANLTVNLDKVDRSLRLVRARKRSFEAAQPGVVAARPGVDVAQPGVEAAGAAPGSRGTPAALDDPALADLGAGLVSPPPSSPEDPIEAEFQRLEHEEVTRHIDRRLGPAPG